MSRALLAARVLLLAALLAASAGAARAVVWPGSVLDLRADARSLGIGFSGVASPWSADAAANPALAVYGAPFEVEWGRDDLAEDEIGRPTVRLARVALASHGVGVSLSGWPDSWLGQTRLTYNGRPGAVADTTGSGGNLFTRDGGPWVGHSEAARNVTLGVSVPTLQRALRGRHEPESPPRFDASLGFGHGLLVDAPGSPDERVVDAVWDAGALVRGTLLDTRRAGREGQSWRLDAALGYAVHHPHFPHLYALGPGAFGRTTEWPTVQGLGAALSLAMRPCPCAANAHPVLWWLSASDKTLLRITLSAESERTQPWGQVDHRSVGAELSLGRVLALRGAFVDDAYADEHRVPFGVGVGLPLGASGVLRWDGAFERSDAYGVASWRRAHTLRLQLERHALRLLGAR